MWVLQHKICSVFASFYIRIVLFCIVYILQATPSRDYSWKVFICKDKILGPNFDWTLFVKLTTTNCLLQSIDFVKTSQFLIAILFQVQTKYCENHSFLFEIN